MKGVISDPSASPETLVIGVGNEMRGDDAAGLQVAHRLRALVPETIRVVDCAGGVAELLDLWEGKDRVYVVDAVRSGGTPSSWVRVSVGDQPLPSSLTGTSTHGLSLASAIALGQILGRMPKRLVVFGIEAVRFSPGAGLSPEVQDAVANVTRALAEELVAAPGPVSEVPRAR